MKSTGTKLHVPAEVVVACIGSILIERGEKHEDALRYAEAIVRGESSTLGDRALVREVSCVLLTLQAHDMLQKRPASYPATEVWALAAGENNTPDPSELWVDRNAAENEAARRTVAGGHKYRVVDLEEALFEIARERYGAS